jgi:hypothetical protein
MTDVQAVAIIRQTISEAMGTEPTMDAWSRSQGDDSGITYGTMDDYRNLDQATTGLPNSIGTAGCVAYFISDRRVTFIKSGASNTEVVNGILECFSL